MQKSDWVDVRDVIQSSLQRAARYFPRRSIETSIAANLPLIRGDSVLLGQVLFNLIDNAAKYGGGEPISVYARSEANDVVIAVTDLGKGIPARDLANIFEKFFRRGKPDGANARHRPWARHRQGVRRSDGRNDQGRKPGRAQARHAHHLAISRRADRPC